MLRIPHSAAVPVMKSSAFAFSYLNLSHCRARPTYEKLRTRLIQSILSISEVPWSADVTMDVHCKIMTTNSITAAAFPDTCQWRTSRAFNLVNLSRPTRTYKQSSFQNHVFSSRVATADSCGLPLRTPSPNSSYKQPRFQTYKDWCFRYS